MVHFSSLIVYSDGTVEQIPPGIFQSTCKVGRIEYVYFCLLCTCKVGRCNLAFLDLDMVQHINM